MSAETKEDPPQAPGWVWKWIPESGLDALQYYAYTGEDLSILAELFLKSFWNWSLQFVPWWIAPNMVTLVGFIFLLLNPIISFLYCGDVWGCYVPRYFFLIFGFNLFVYQLMDNLDGKQARRTGNSSALGELFDHGCDSLFMLLWTVPTVLTLHLTPAETWFIQSLGMLIFYASHWEEYHTNMLILPRYANPTEGQVMFILLSILTFFVGPDYFNQPLLSNYFPFLAQYGIKSIHDLVVWFLPFGITAGVCSNGYDLYKWCKKTKYNFLWATTVLLPLILHFVFLGFWMKASRLDELHPTLLFLFNGIMGSWITDQLMVSRICKMPAPRVSLLVGIPFIGVLNALFDHPIPTSLLFQIVAFGGMALFVYWCISITFQLSYHLNIPIIYLKPGSKGPKEWEAELKEKEKAAQTEKDKEKTE